jgi:hypothetical protein
MATNSISGEVSSPVIELGLVRFKLIAGVQATVTPNSEVRATASNGASVGVDVAISRNDSTDQMAASVVVSATYVRQISEHVAAGVSNSISSEQIASLIAQPSCIGFATALFRNFNASLTFNEWLTLQGSLDSDFCFFSARVNFAPNALRLQTGSTVLSATSNLTLAFGPSRAAWLRMGLFLGPRFLGLVARMVPSAAPTTATLAGETTFFTWIGAIGFAIPMGIALQTFVNTICDMARERGIARGNFNQVGMAYARRAYSMLGNENPRDPEVIVGRNKAYNDIQRYGAASVRRYLEEQFRGGRAVPPAHSSRGMFDFWAVNEVGDQLGEAMYRTRGR